MLIGRVWYAILKHVPFITVEESQPLRLEQLQTMIARIMEEKKTQWNYNNPGKEFPGVTEKELREALEERWFERR